MVTVCYMAESFGHLTAFAVARSTTVRSGTDVG